LIVTSCEDLLDRAQKDEVLQQLYYRLNVLPLQVPALRERPDDVPELVRFYADWFPNLEKLPYRPFSVAAQNRLRNHSWPGNIRELRNLVQQLLVLGGEGEVSVAEVEEALRQNPTEPAGSGAQHPAFFDLPLREARERFEREYLIYKLKEAGGSVGKLSETVGMERTHLYRKLRALGVDPKTAEVIGDK
jgi:DNA-binding NtrC family response regulator